MDGVTVEYSNGDKLSVKGLANFTVISSNRNYLMYTLNEYADSGLIKVYIACLDDTNNLISDEEWDQIKKLMSKMTHKEALEDLKFATFENKTFGIGSIRPKKLGLKQAQIDAIIDYQSNRIANDIRNDDTAVIEEDKERKSFFDTSLIAEQDKTKEVVDTGVNIFDSPLQPEFETPVEEKEENKENKEEIKQETSESPQFIETPTIDTFKPMEQQVIDLKNDINEINNKINEGSVNMLPSEKEQIKEALEKASAALSEATVAVENAKSLVEKINTESMSVQSEVQPVAETPVVDVQPVVAEPQIIEQPVIEAPVVEAQPAVVEPQIIEQPAVEAPVVEAQPVVAEPQIIEQPVVEAPVVEAQPIVSEPQVMVGEAQPIENFAQPQIVNAEPTPISVEAPVVVNAEPAPIQSTVEAQPVVASEPVQAFVEPQVNQVVSAPEISVSPIVEQSATPAVPVPDAPLFGTPETAYVEPNYSEVPPAIPTEVQAEAPQQVYGPGSLDAGVQEAGVQRQLTA